MARRVCFSDRNTVYSIQRDERRNPYKSTYSREEGTLLQKLGRRFDLWDYGELKHVVITQPRHPHIQELKEYLRIYQLIRAEYFND